MTLRGMGVLVLALGLLGPLAAQEPDDEQLEEQRRQDELYHQRYATPAPEAAPVAGDQAAVERALALIRDSNHRALRTESVVLDTDDPRIDLRAVARLVEVTRRLFETVFRERSELAPDHEPARLFLFWSYADYNQLVGGSFGRSLLRPKGHYGTMFDAIALHTDSDAPGGLGDTIVHEVAHRLIDRRLYAGGGVPPPWLAEGLAEYFGRTRVDEHEAFEPGVVGAKAVPLFTDGKARGDTADSKGRLRSLERALRTRETAIAGPVIRADPAAFYGESALAHYATAWLIVHWLLDGGDPARAAGFAEYLTLDRRGEGGAEAFFRAIGVAEADLDAALLEHAGHVRVR